jgi:4'-phosphopantetheinyl transferase EntD
MPIFFQQDIDVDTRLGIWKIEEDEEFFLQTVVPQRNVSHPHKKLQHLAGRYLLKYLFPDFPLSLILVADTRKPYLENEAYHFSISHCGDYAAVIVSKTKRVGIDIEIPNEKILKIAHKFLHTDENLMINNWDTVDRQQVSTILWSAKEAMFKWWGKGNVDFSEMLRVSGSLPEHEGLFNANFIKGSINASFPVPYKIFPQIVLAWVATAPALPEVID